MKTIKDVEEQVCAKLSPLLEQLELLLPGYVCSVRLHGESRKKRQSALLEKNWHPDSDSIQISFERAAASPQAPSHESVSPSHRPITTPPASDPLADLIRALDRAESRPGYSFVALKWFRDTALLSEGFSWSSSDSARKSVLTEAIDNKLVLTNSVVNPKSPYPTTAIRLNRLMPQVQAILGIEEQSPPDFSPLRIRGENLSATVLRDRR